MTIRIGWDFYNGYYLVEDNPVKGGKGKMYTQEVIDFINRSVDIDHHLMNWKESKKWEEKKKEVIEYIRKLSGVH